MVGAVAQPQCLLRGERVVVRHHRDQALLDRHQRPEAGVERRAVDRDEIDRVGLELGHGAIVIGHPHLERDIGVASPEGGDLTRQEVVGERLAAGDPHGAALEPAQILDLRLHPLDVAGLLAQIAHEHLAGCGEAHAARLALEQRGAELLLQIHDAAVDGRGRDGQPLRRLADRAGAGDLVDIAQDSQVAHGGSRVRQVSGRRQTSECSVMPGRLETPDPASTSSRTERPAPISVDRTFGDKPRP